MKMMMMVQWDLLIVRKVGKGLGHRVVHGKFKQFILGDICFKRMDIQFTEAWTSQNIWHHGIEKTGQDIRPFYSSAQEVLDLERWYSGNTSDYQVHQVQKVECKAWTTNHGSATCSMHYTGRCPLHIARHRLFWSYTCQVKEKLSKKIWMHLYLFNHASNPYWSIPRPFHRFLLNGIF